MIANRLFTLPELLSPKLLLCILPSSFLHYEGITAISQHFTTKFNQLYLLYAGNSVAIFLWKDDNLKPYYRFKTIVSKKKFIFPHLPKNWSFFCFSDDKLYRNDANMPDFEDIFHLSLKMQHNKTGLLIPKKWTSSFAFPALYIEDTTFGNDIFKQGMGIFPLAYWGQEENLVKLFKEKIEIYNYTPSFKNWVLMQYNVDFEANILYAYSTAILHTRAHWQFFHHLVYYRHTKILWVKDYQKVKEIAQKLIDFYTTRPYCFVPSKAQNKTLRQEFEEKEKIEKLKK